MREIDELKARVKSLEDQIELLTDFIAEYAAGYIKAGEENGNVVFFREDTH